MSISQRILDRWNSLSKGGFEDDIYSDHVDEAKEETPEIERARTPSFVPEVNEPSVEAPVEEVEELASFGKENPFSGGFRSTLWDKLNPDLIPETPEEAALRERRDRSRSTIAAISDGLAGIANMWGVVGGAENIKLSSLSDVNRKRMEKAQELRDRYRDAYSRGRMQAEVLDYEERLRAEKEAKADKRYEEEKTYKRAQDEEAKKRQEDIDAINKEKAEWGIIQSKELHPGNLEKQKLEIEATKARINASNAAASAALAKNAGVSEGKMTKFKSFALTDNTIVDIPEAIHDSYVADVYNYMVGLSGLDGAEFNKLLMESNLGMNESTSSKMRTAVQRLASTYPGVEDYMKTRADELTQAYYRHLNPDSVTQITPSGASKGFVPTPENLKGNTTGKAPTYTKGGVPYFGIDPKIKEQINQEQAEIDANKYPEIPIEEWTPEMYEAYEQDVLNRSKK